MNRTVKKIFCVLLCAVLAFGALLPASAAGYALGDVDNSGKVDTKDARLALRAAIGLDTLTAEQTTAADVDGSGKVATDDARIILRVAIGLMIPDETGTRFIDAPGASDRLGAFIVKYGEQYASDLYRLSYQNEYGDTITYTYNTETGGFQVVFRETIVGYEEDFEFACSAWCNKDFQDYGATSALLDARGNIIEATNYTLDPTQLNPNSGADSLKEYDYYGDESIRQKIRDLTAYCLCFAFSMLLQEAQADGVNITANQMHLYRVLEPYLG